MNRYSLIFALLMASSLAVHSPGPGTERPSTSTANRMSTASAKSASVGQASSLAEAAAQREGKNPSLNGPLQLIQRFLSNINPAQQQTNDIKVLFATLPHPTETHLAAEFDHNVEAMQDGIQAAGYVFDSSYIPWARHEPRETFEDDEKERAAKKDEDALPGILIFRRNVSAADAYTQGLVVFLCTEKPTKGIAFGQTENALSLLRQSGIRFAGPIRILGPNYTGSLASLVSVIKTLHSANPDSSVRIRSGSVSGGRSAACTMEEISKQLPGIQIDFGSAQYNNPDWTRVALNTLAWMGIDDRFVATLNENESSYGAEKLHEPNAGGETQSNHCSKLKETHVPPVWSLSFPRDISSLRAGYEKQGILNSGSVAQPWKRVLELTSGDEGEGDTVKSFGGSATIAAQESVLFGISEFLKAHAIRAVIISATNEEDVYFLSQFMHAHNSDVRVVEVGTTRLFMRGSTAQFRGDLVVDGFPFFARLHDWTQGGRNSPAYVFANDVAQGTFFAAIDLLVEPAGQNSLYPEYSRPYWSGRAPDQYPPMYVVALGGNLTWPVSEFSLAQFQDSAGDRESSWKVKMPFTLFDGYTAAPANLPSDRNVIRVGLTWRMLFLFLVLCTAVYCVCFLYANSIAHTLFSSFEPSGSWRFWLFKVAVPATLFGAAFRLLSWTNEMPSDAAPSVLGWGYAAEAMTIVAPLIIAISAAGKMLITPAPKWCAWMLLALVPVVFHAISYFITGYHSDQAFAHLDVGPILAHYREMHWESGLSLVPTGLLFLFALFIWSAQAGNGAAILETVPVLPEYPENQRVSNERAKRILSVARPLPSMRGARWLWLVWVVTAAAIALAHFYFPPYRRITTLESIGITHLLLFVSMTVIILLLLDLLQFLWLWHELRGLLQSLDRQIFKRSFVPIKNFRWRNLWSFSGTSFGERAEIEAAQVDRILDLALKYRIPNFLQPARILKRLRSRYTRVSIAPLSLQKRRYNRALFYNLVQAAGNHAATLVEGQRYYQPPATSPPAEQSKDGGRFQDEEEELARLPDWQQAAEKLLCLIYINFIQTIVARLHTLLISIASLFSLVTLGFAIYPFAPFFPLLVSGLALIVLIAWAFYKVFSEMDTDRTLSRIVNGDDRKLEKEFYFKFAESLALPLLTLGSSLLPGGAGRLLEMVQTLLSHAD
jgi:hypothetical protein